MNFVSKAIKRGIDIAGAAVGLTTLAPLLAATSIMVGWRLGRPVLFRQKRPGFNGEPFWIIKFRTMTDERDEQGKLLGDSDRLTPLGHFLRRTSIDELPELINVLKGDMSLVGPRPLRMAYLKHYSAKQARRHDVKPGVTGWAQVNGRNTLTWEDKFDLDVWYVDNQSIGLDVAILIKTIGQVLFGQDISHEGYATMPKFTGNPQEPEKAGQA